MSIEFIKLSFLNKNTYIYIYTDINYDGSKNSWWESFREREYFCEFPLQLLIIIIFLKLNKLSLLY